MEGLNLQPNQNTVKPPHNHHLKNVGQMFGGNIKIGQDDEEMKDDSSFQHEKQQVKTDLEMFKQASMKNKQKNGGGEDSDQSISGSD